jgi:formate/nitrite transporter FocA (FNT family)
MLMGAKVSIFQWWVWNQIPVTLGNIVGGLLFTGLALYATYKPTAPLAPKSSPVTAHMPAE